MFSKSKSQQQEYIIDILDLNCQSENNMRPQSGKRFFKNIKMYGNYIFGLNQPNTVLSTGSLSGQIEDDDITGYDGLVQQQSIDQTQRSNNQIPLDPNIRQGSRWGEGNLTESEFKQILDVYNQSINECSQQTLELRENLQHHQIILKEAEQKYFGVQQELKELNQIQVLEQAELETKKFQIELYKVKEQIISQEKQVVQNNDFEELFNDINSELNNNTVLTHVEKQELNDNLKGQANYMQQLKQELQQLQQLESYLNQSIDTMTLLNEKEKQCSKCFKLYKPSENSETSCSFHPGKLKFFSCRGCGADEYYVCCWKCSKCIEGCRYQKHLSSD